MFISEFQFVSFVLFIEILANAWWKKEIKAKQVCSKNNNINSKINEETNEH